MALTLNTTTVVFRDKWMQCLVRRATLTGPASYTTGGIAIDNVGDFGWGSTETLQGTLSNGTNFYGLYLDFANQKIKVSAAGVEVANAVDLSGYTGIIVATGH